MVGSMSTKTGVLAIVAVLILLAGAWWYFSTTTSPISSSVVETATTTKETNQPAPADSLVAIGQTGFMANHTSVVIPVNSERGNSVTTLTHDSSGNHLTFSDPAHLKIFGSMKGGNVYLASATNLYKIDWGPGSSDISLQSISGIDGATLTSTGNENFYRDKSGVYCWANGLGGGGIEAKYRVFSPPLSDSIEIYDIYSDNPANAKASQTNNFIFAALKDVTKGTYYKLTSPPNQLCENTSLVPISVDDYAKLVS